jgi:Male sterility protein
LRQSTKLRLHGLPTNFVYSNPSISSLTAFVLSLFANYGGADVQNLQKDVKHMEAMVEKYSSAFASRSVRDDAASRPAVCEVVLLTGTTGRLGSHLLAQLAMRPDVKTVYALNRVSAGSLEERQRAIFESWRLDTGLLDSGKIVLLTADLTRPFFGLMKDVYNEVKTIMHPIHLAFVFTCAFVGRYKTRLQASFIMVSRAVSVKHAQFLNFL